MRQVLLRVHVPQLICRRLRRPYELRREGTIIIPLATNGHKQSPHSVHATGTPASLVTLPVSPSEDPGP